LLHRDLLMQRGRDMEKLPPNQH